MRSILLRIKEHFVITPWVGLPVMVLSALFVYAPVAAVAADALGTVYEIDQIQLDYQRSHPDNPPLASLRSVAVDLGVDGDVYVAPGSTAATKSVTLNSVGSGASKRFAGSAIRHISASLLAHLNSQGLAGVWVGVHPQDINPKTGEDLRPGKKGALRMLVQTATVGSVRTVARGDRLDPGAPNNNPAHGWILQNSPVKPGDSQASSDLLNKDELNDYARFLSRHIGRRVDLAVSPMPNVPGAVSLDYIVYEQRPWTAWAQATNTGTSQTNDWRATLGFQHTQLTGKDDQLDILYSSAGMDRTHFTTVSYELPIVKDRHNRLRADFSWNEYLASDVGFAGMDFKGKTYSSGIAMVQNIKQSGNLFYDLVYGFKYDKVSVENQIIGRSGEAKFFFVDLGLEIKRYSRFGNTLGSLHLSFSPFNQNRDDLEALGRTKADSNFAILSWYLSHSFYLDRFFDESSTKLAHEIVFSVNGQSSNDKRLVPNYQSVLGGMNSVRGYPESFLAGDTVSTGTLEYRFHVPQVLGVSKDPGIGPIFGGPFRFLPQHAYGVTDWDLALKGFLDVGYACSADELTFEYDQVLWGAGVGFDFRFRRNLFITVDWGFAMTDTNDYQTVDAWSSQVGISATIMY